MCSCRGESTCPPINMYSYTGERWIPGGVDSWRASEYVGSYGEFLLVDVLFLAPDPCFPFWGRRLVSPLGTVSRADMLWKDAMLAVLRWQVDL